MKRSILSIMGTVALSATLASGAKASAELAACLSEDVVQFDGTVVDAALALPELSTLVDAVVAAGLDDDLAEAEDITVYAPTNDAFAAVPGVVLDAILADEALLGAVLTYHVSPVLDDPRRYVPAVRRDTLQGQKVFFSRYGQEPRVNQAAVDCQGYRTDNGFVWLIDSVLIPQF
jgi:uncharacterized surface protein with fasciclin (FAS1) repeats